MKGWSGDCRKIFCLSGFEPLRIGLRSTDSYNVQEIVPKEYTYMYHGAVVMCIPQLVLLAVETNIPWGALVSYSYYIVR